MGPYIYIYIYGGPKLEFQAVILLLFLGDIFNNEQDHLCNLLCLILVSQLSFVLANGKTKGAFLTKTEYVAIITSFLID